MMATVREASAIAKKQQALRDHLWPGKEQWLWDRKKQKGFTTIPKTMPMILKIMDEMTKGTPVSATYLTLWCNTWDNNFVILNKNPDMANASGFGGQRGEHTWATRMKLLQDLEFIDIKPGKSGPLGNAIIWNPHFILRWHHHIKTPGLTEASYNALIETALEVGVADMTMDWPVPHSPRTAPPPPPPPPAMPPAVPAGPEAPAADSNGVV
ncbi:hypothetical protein [Aurantiacibacter xanthus]|uniref:hypothetical protein n=1 Tax=Aurantiacibacter xanthus TaxID=1784712 RepID=UPI0017493CA2|nr:hypothetical protein [Aurantiacibacter xanthus]